MPMPDPLDNIMNVLKNKGTVDHNQAAARSARLKDHRGKVGANPPATRKPPHQGAKKKAGKQVPPDAMPMTPNAPQGASEDFQENPNMMSVVVDGLNEAIIGLKTEIHRANDPETKKNLEQQAKAIRQQVVDMGGEPIYADESIEEGLKKLRGHGIMGARQLFGGATPTAVDPKYEEARKTGFNIAQGDQAQTTSSPAPSTSMTPSPGSGFGGSSFDFSFNAPTVTAPKVTAPKVEIPDVPDKMTADHGPDFFGEHVADPSRDGAVDQLEELINNVTGREPTPMPEMQVDTDMVNELVERYGLQPRTPEEIQETAQAVVERQKISKEQLVQRELDRFEREHDQEFAKAQKQISEAASRASADKQEEMAARGMFYSSVMGNALGDITDKEMELIGEIAESAANRVADLHLDLRDIEEWAIVEEEFLQKQLEAEDQELRRSLMSMHLEVATWSDQMALDRWYKENAMNLQHDQMNLQGVQMKIAYAEHQGQNLAAAFMADHPLVQNTLVDMGIGQEKFGQMSLEEQAGLVRSVVNFNEIEQQTRMNEMQMRAVVTELALKQANMELQASISTAQMGLQASIASGQFQMQGLGMALDMAQHRDRMDLSWAQHGLDEKSLSWQMSRGTGGTGVAAQDPAKYEPFDVLNMGSGAAQAGDVNLLNYWIGEANKLGYKQEAQTLQGMRNSLQTTEGTQTQSSAGGTANNWLKDFTGLPSDIKAPMGAVKF